MSDVQHDTTSNNAIEEKPMEHLLIDDKFKLNDEQKLEVLKYCQGYSNYWRDTYSKESTLWVGKCDGVLLAFAFLATVDDMMKQYHNNRYNEIIVHGLLSDGWLRHAYNVTKFATHDVFYKTHRIIVPSNEFNKNIHIGKIESRTIINEASVWTLLKAFRGQFLAAVESLFPRGLKGLPIVKAEPQKKNSKQKDNSHNTKCPENATWNRIVNCDLVNILYTLQDSINSMMTSSVDLSEYIKYAKKVSVLRKKHTNERTHNRLTQDKQFHGVRTNIQSMPQNNNTEEKVFVKRTRREKPKKQIDSNGFQLVTKRNQIV